MPQNRSSSRHQTIRQQRRENAVDPSESCSHMNNDACGATRIESNNVNGVILNNADRSSEANASGVIRIVSNDVNGVNLNNGSGRGKANTSGAIRIKSNNDNSVNLNNVNGSCKANSAAHGEGKRESLDFLSLQLDEAMLQSSPLAKRIFRPGEVIHHGMSGS